MNKKILLALILFSALSCAGTLTAIVYNATSSTGPAFQGLVLNSSSGVRTSYAKDLFANATIDTPPWYTNSTGSVSFTEGTSGGVNYIRASSGTALTDLGNFTYYVDLNQSVDTNTTFYFLATPTLSELRLTNCFWGCSTKTDFLKNNTINVPSTVFAWVYFNFTSKKVQYYQSGVLSNTVDVSTYDHIYLSFTARGNGIVGSTIEVDNYINATKIGPIVESDYVPVLAWVQYSNGTVSGSANVTGATSLGIAPLGSSNFSVNKKNFWVNTTEVVAIDGNYYYFAPDSIITNNASLYFRVFDESTLQPINFSVAFSNSTNSTLSRNFSNFFWSNYTGISNGKITIALTNYSYDKYYFPSNYIVDFNSYPEILGSSQLNLTLYMLPQSLTTGLFSIKVVATNGAPIPGASVSIARFLNGAWTRVDSQTTGTDGVASFYVDQNAQYQISIIASGYNPFVATTYPSGGTYTATLSSSTASNFTGSFYNLTFVMNPSNSYVNVNGSSYLDFNVTVNSSDCLLSSFTFTVSNASQQLSSQVTSAPCGGSSNWTILTAPYLSAGVNSELFNVTLLISKSGAANVTITQYYTVQFTSGTGFDDALYRFSANSTGWVNALIAIALSLLFTLFFSKYLGFGSGLITMLSLGVFTYYGFISGGVFIVAAIVAICLMYLGRFGL